MKRRAIILTGAGIACAAIAAAGFVTFDPVWKASRTQSGPLPAIRSEYYTSAWEYASVLPQLGQLQGDGVRFVANPFRGRRDYAVAIWRRGSAAHAEGVLVTFDRDTGKAGNPVHFDVPAVDYSESMHQLDGLVDWWIGEGKSCLDGTGIAFERVRRSQVVSGEGNAACSDHFGAISAILFRLAKPARFLDEPPRGYTWNP